MKRPINICSGQFGDMPLENLCREMNALGYNGFEIATQAHVDVNRIVSDEKYREEFKATLAKYDMQIGALSAHLAGQCVGDNWDPRLDNFAPNELSGQPEKIRQWAIEFMKTTARAAQLLGVKVVTCFLGSPIWAMWYSFPQTTPEMVEAGFQKIKELWTPIFDVYDECGVKLALEVHPTEIAFDYWSTKRLLETLDYRPTLGINFDPSHLLWQGVNPAIFLRDFADRIYHVHLKDVKVNRGRPRGHSRLAHRIRRHPPRLELRLPRPWRCGFRCDHSRAESDGLSRPAVRGMGGFRHGAHVRREGSVRICA